MANFLQLGFTPVGSTTRAQARKYTVASAYAPSNSLPGIAVGEVVKPVNDGTIAVANAGDATILGVVAAVSYVDSTGTRQYGGYLPTGHTYSGDADILNPRAPWILVWDDPGIEYLAALVTASSTILTNFQLQFNTMDLSATSSTTMDTVYKRSLRTLDGTGATGAAQFKINEILRSPAQDYAANHLQVKCMINEGVHGFFDKAQGI